MSLFVMVRDKMIEFKSGLVNFVWTESWERSI